MACQTFDFQLLYRVKSRFTDTSLLRTVIFVPGESHTYYIWTPINADNRHLFLAQLTDFHRKSTSLTQTLLCQLTSFFIDLVFCSNKGCIFTSTRRVYYACIGLQWSNIFYAEFKALPKPSIKYKMQLCRLSMNEKFMPKTRDPLHSEGRPTIGGIETPRLLGVSSAILSFFDIDPTFFFFRFGHRQLNNSTR